MPSPRSTILAATRCRDDSAPAARGTLSAEMGLWSKLVRLIRRESDDDDSHGQWSDARDQMLDAKVAALGDNPAPPGYLPKPDDGRPRY
jgi:hypothetical protein